MAEEKNMQQPMVGRRTFVKGGLAASALAALAACTKNTSSSSSSSSTTKGGTLKYYLNNPECIDPFNVQEDQGTTVEYQLFDALTDYDFTKDQLVYLAAESCDVNSDATKFTFHLRKNCKFHNGDAVNAKAFKRGWERICNPATTDSPSVISYHLALVKGYDDMVAGKATELPGLTCPDDNTFVVELSASYADFQYVCSHPALAPVPEAATKDFKTFYLAPIGNGPFQMDGKWEDGQYINIKRFDGYTGAKANGTAKLDGVYFNIQKDVETAYKEFQAGNIDICSIPSSQIADAVKTYGKSDDGYTITKGKQVLLGSEPATYYLTCNVSNSVMKDKNLRHAISLAINRQAICDGPMDGTREPATNIVAPGIKGFEAGAWADARYDKDAAVKILDQYYPADANGKRQLQLKLSYNQDGSHKQIMELVIADLNAVGIDVVSDTKEWAAILKDYQAGNYMFGRLGWIADYPIMDNFLYPLFYTGNGDNRSQYSNTAVDTALMAARSTVDDAERLSKLQAVNKMIAEDMPVIPLMFYKHSEVGSEKIKSCYLDPQKKPDFGTAEMNA